jgi:glycosyltransferase involved in cell wall biosynthesis
MVMRDRLAGPRLFWLHPKLMDYRLDFFNLVSQRFHVRFFFQERSPILHDLCCVHGRRGIIAGRVPDRVPFDDIRCIAYEIRHSDIFISSFIWNSYTIIGLIIAKVLRKKVIIWEELNFFTAGPKKKIKYACCRVLAKFVDAFFVLGKVQRQALEQLGVGAERIFVANEYPAHLYSTVESQEIPLPFFGNGQKIVLYLGRLVACKGVEYLIRAFAAINDRDNLALLIVGEGPLRGELENLAKTLGISRIHFAGHVSSISEKAYLFQRCSVVVVPSIISCDGQMEGGPLVVLEALSAGKPVIGTNCIGSSAEWVETGINGYLVPEKNPQALQWAIMQVLESDQFTKERILATFSLWQGFPHQVGEMVKAISYVMQDS